MHRDPSFSTSGADSADEVFRRVAHAVSLPIDEHFFDEMTRRITETLAVTGGLIAAFDSVDHTRIRTRSFLINGRSLGGIEYSIHGTPCAEVVRGNSYVVESGIRQRFPNDPMLVEQGLDAYAGTPVFDPAGAVIGLVAVFSDRPFHQPQQVLAALRIFAARVAAEFERRRAEQAISDSAQRYWRLFAHNPLPMWVYDLETLRFLAVNDAAIDRYGYTRDEFLAMTIADIRPEEDIPALRDNVARVTEGFDRAGIWRHRLKDGRIIRVRIDSHTLEFDGRRAELVLALDVTEQLAAEDALRESERRFRQLAENIDHVFWMSTPDKNRMLYVSPAYERVWGQPCAALYRNAHLWFEAIHPDDRPAILTALPGQIERRYNEQYRIVRPDGTVRWIADRAFPVRDETGAIYRIAGVAQDITERKRTEQLLHVQSSALEAAANAIVITDRDGRIEWANPAFGEISGYSLEEARGKRPGDLVRSGVQDQAFYERLWATILSGRVWQGRIVNRRRDGELRTEEMTITPIRNERDEITHFIAVKRDITDRLALEEQLHRTRRLEAIGQLTGGIAHDFNNLLTVILGNAELLTEELTEDSRLYPIAEMIVQGAQRGAELTHRLLAFARKQPLEPKPVDANQLIGSMGKMLRRTLGEHIHVEIMPGNGSWSTLIDPGQLESALLNLALNARDAMPEGGTLIIETANTEIDPDYAGRYGDVQPGEYVLVAVSDTGCGIPPERLDRVFKPFYTTKEQGKGTGLGLAMVYGFIKQSRGHIELYSQTGHGTTVKMYLPRITDTAEPGAGFETEISDTSGNECILLVEDNEMVSTYAETLLRNLGYRVLTASNGPEALAVLRQHADIDLLFTDIVMPGGMNGRELAEAARTLYPELKVLYTSGYTENAIVHHGRLAPGVQLLSKPYRRAELARRIREVLDLKW